MTHCSVTAQEFELWRRYIYQHSGIFLRTDKAYLIEHRLRRVLGEEKCANFAELYRKAKNSRANDPLTLRIIDAITTNETFWFRDKKVFDFFGAEILPKMHRELEQGRRGGIRIWSAACSTGQEPYSIAMCALDAYSLWGGDDKCRQELELLATDISGASLKAAEQGCYDSVSLARGLSTSHRNRYFQPNGDGWQVKPRLRALVEFKQVNLRGPLANLGRFDIIFLRNVIIYFSDQVKRELFTRLRSVAAPGCLLFLGTGETLIGYSDSFEMLEQGGNVYYRLKARG